jgi:hypothetical protein
VAMTVFLTDLDFAFKRTPKRSAPIIGGYEEGSIVGM